jgi:hypothetical protein
LVLWARCAGTDDFYTALAALVWGDIVFKPFVSLGGLSTPGYKICIFFDEHLLAFLSL